MMKVMLRQNPCNYKIYTVILITVNEIFVKYVDQENRLVRGVVRQRETDEWIDAVARAEQR